LHGNLFSSAKSFHGQGADARDCFVKLGTVCSAKTIGKQEKVHAGRPDPPACPASREVGQGKILLGNAVADTMKAIG
jgi:hypothetical protein